MKESNSHNKVRNYQIESKLKKTVISPPSYIIQTSFFRGKDLISKEAIIITKHVDVIFRIGLAFSYCLILFKIFPFSLSLSLFLSLTIYTYIYEIISDFHIKSVNLCKNRQEKLKFLYQYFCIY